MTRNEILKELNRLTLRYNLTWDDVKMDADKALYQINTLLSCDYPSISTKLTSPTATYTYRNSLGVDVPIIKDIYFYTVIFPYMAMEILARDEEFTTVYQKYQQDFIKGKHEMFSNEFNYVPDRYKRSQAGGVFFPSNNKAGNYVSSEALPSYLEVQEIEPSDPGVAPMTPFSALMKQEDVDASITTHDRSTSAHEDIRNIITAKANDSAVMKLTGDQVVSGVKNFTGNIKYNGETLVTSKDLAAAVTDVLEVTDTYAKQSDLTDLSLNYTSFKDAANANFATNNDLSTLQTLVDTIDDIISGVDDTNVIDKLHEVFALLQGTEEADTLVDLLGYKVDKAVFDAHKHDSDYYKVETGKELITTTEKEKLSGVETNANNYDDTDVRGLIDAKVDKVSGKSLISDEEITRLAGVDNYDDTEVKTLITTIQSVIASIDGEDDTPDTVINKLHEIVALLNGYAEGTTLADLLRGKVDKADGKGLSTNDYTTAEKEKLLGIEPSAQSDWLDSNSESPSFIKNKPLDIVLEVNGTDFLEDYEKENIHATIMSIMKLDLSDIDNTKFDDIIMYADQGYSKYHYTDICVEPLVGLTIGFMRVVDSSNIQRLDIVVAFSIPNEVSIKKTQLRDVRNFYSLDDLPTLPDDADTVARYLFSQDHDTTLFVVKPLGLIYDYYSATNKYRCLNDYVKSDDLSMVATTGSYNDLTNTPTIPTIPNISITNGTTESGKYISQVAVDETDKHKLVITKADLPQGFSGNYDDLIGTPTIPSKTSDLENDSNFATETYVDNKVSSVYKVKGTVANYSSLPSANNVIGDVWNLTDTGANYVWDGSAWDKLGDTVDLSAYAKTTDLFSKNYNDLTNKPTIPTVPTISTNITTDATSDAKTASPKAVKTYVDNAITSALGGLLGGSY